MTLLTQELRRKLPKLYQTETQGMSAIVYAHYFMVDADYDWYITEFDGTETLFGLTRGFYLELVVRSDSV